MSDYLLINLFSFAIGVAACLFIIFSIIMRTVRKEFSKMKDDFLNQMKEERISAVHR